MTRSELLIFVEDFFNPTKEVSHESIPEIMEWKKEYLERKKDISSCCSIGLDMEYSTAIKKRIYGKK